MTYPKTIASGVYRAGHCQGIAVDAAKGYVYYSFTTMLVKTDLNGRFVGSVTGLCGHLGCIAFHADDGCVYGSLEYKNDAIGKGILKMLDSDRQIPDRFYIAIFDADKITEADMPAQDIMRCAYLAETTADYNAVWNAPDGMEIRHRYGCSGVDGTAIGPMFGCAPDSKKYLFIAYGVYGDSSRTDNDYQVLLRYDPDELRANSAPLDQSAMHETGPAHLGKYFVFTGNTVYGVQNLEYDPVTHTYFMAVYRGKKEAYPNPPMFAVDASTAPVKGILAGAAPDTEAEILTLDSHGISGYSFGRGQTGMVSLGDGFWYFSHEGRREDGQFTDVKLYRYANGNFSAVE